MSTTPRNATLSALPEADTRLLARPPLELVICEVRTVSSAHVPLGPQEALRLQEIAAESGFPVERLEPAQQQAIELQITPGRPPAPHVETRSSGWQLKTSDQSGVATIFPGVMTIQTTQYTSWEATFRPYLAGVLAGVSKVLDPSIRQRVGLRYVDRLTDSTASTAATWQGRVSDAVLGPIVHPVFGERILGSQQQVELDVGDGRTAMLRHGPFIDGALRNAVSYLIDIDVLDLTTSPFDIESTLAVADELNRTALSIFQASLNPEYLAELRGEA